MTLTELRDWLKKLCGLSTAYIGRIDAAKTNIIGVYNLGTQENKRVPFGEKAYIIKSYSILVHGDASKSNTEKFAQGIYNKLDAVHSTKIGKTNIIDLQLKYDAPIDVNYSENNIYEYVIEFNLIMEV